MACDNYHQNTNKNVVFYNKDFCRTLYYSASRTCGMQTKKRSPAPEAGKHELSRIITNFDEFHELILKFD